MAISKLLYMKDCGGNYPGRHLKLAINYICDLDKTQQGRLIGGHNCQPEYAYEQMKETKRHFGKTNKRQAYHFIISFAEGEVDADTAFAFTQDFVKEYLADKYEAVYTVHDNTKHIHSHVVFNSVSCFDGIKYQYKNGDWTRDIQPITNRLCEKYGLSIFEIEKGNARVENKIEQWDSHKSGPFLWGDMVKRDVDACILQAETFEEFVVLMKSKGYEVKQNKYLAVKGMDMGRFVRLKTLGEDYTESRIQERILTENLSTYRAETLEEAEKVVYSQIPYGKRAKLTGLQKKYYAKLYRIGLLKRRPYSQAWKYKKDIKEFHKLQEQYLFLVDNKIETIGELQLEAETLADKRKLFSAEKSRIYRARQKCKGLFDVQEQMQEYKVCEEAYQKGDNFFEEEHDVWITLEKQLQEQGYSYEEVERLKEHYRRECARVRMQEGETKKKLKIANSILKEIETEVQEKLEQKEKEKIKEKEQPIR